MHPTQHSADSVGVSTVTPVYRGHEYLRALVDRLSALREEWSERAPLHLLESVFVDDGSDDGSAELLRELDAEHAWVRVVTLSRNFGQHPATAAGILHSSGEWVVTLDEDLQHDPAHIVELLRTVAADERGLDVVYARPQGNVHGGVLRDLSSRTYKALLAWATGDPRVREFNSFRLVRGSVARAAASVCGHETYLDVAIGWFTGRCETVLFEMSDLRHMEAGSSGYSFRSLLSHARRAVVSSQAKVLRIAALMGLVAVLASAVMAVRVLVLRLILDSPAEVPGWSSLFVSGLFFGGVLSFLLAIVLEYLTNVVLHTQGKPAFFVVDRTRDEILRAFFEREGVGDAPPAHQ